VRKTVDNQSDTLLLHPVRVVSLVRQGPGVALHNHRQPLSDGFTDAPRARLSDEEICQLHEVRDVARESLHVHRDVPLDGAQFRGHLLVLST